jgi:MFS family permease
VVDPDRRMCGVFMLLLDITVVNVALPDIQRSLHSSFSDLQWVVNAYALTLAALLLTSGSFALVRSRDFVTSPNEPQGHEPEPVATAAG